MSPLQLNDLLHKTIKELHKLHTFPLTNESEYGTLLVGTIKNILQLLNYYDKLYNELEMSVNHLQGDIGTASFLYYLDRPVSKREDISNLNILQSIQSYQNNSGNSTSDILKQLVKLLANLNDKKPTRIKDSYSDILVKFSEMLNFFIKLHHESDLHLINYINKCFTYELSFYSDLQDQLDSDLSLNNEDTERIVNFLDKIIDSNHIKSQTTEKDDDSIFFYEAKGLNPILDDVPLRFKSNDDNFNSLYQLFLQILSFRRTNAKDQTEYIKIMINLFKKLNNVTCLEVNNFKFKELKFNFFYNFFIGDVNKSGFTILPTHFKSTNERVMSELAVFPESDYQNNYQLYSQSRGYKENSFVKSESPNISVDIPNLSQISNVSSSYSKISNIQYTKDDRFKLLNNLRHIVPLLNEFNLNFNLRFPSTFNHYMQLLYEELTDIGDSLDFDYTNNVVNLVNTIVDFENEESISDEESIKETVFQFYRLHSYLNKESINNKDLTLLMKLAIKEFNQKFNSKKMILHNWNFKTLSVSQLEFNLVNYWIPQSNSNLQRRYLKKWFNRTLKFSKLEFESSTYYGKSLMDKYLNSIWLPNTLRNKRLLNKSETLSTKKYLKLWHNQTIEKHKLLHLAYNYDRGRLLDEYFHIYLIKYQNQLELVSNAISMNRNLVDHENRKLKALIWAIWYNKMNARLVPISVTKSDSKEPSFDPLINNSPPSTLSEKLTRLTNLENHFIRLKYFRKWKYSFEIKSVFNKVQIKNNEIFIKFIFNEQWLKKTRLQLIAKDIIMKKNHILKRSTFDYWKEFKNLQDVANNFFRKNTLTTVLKLWELKTIAEQVKNEEIHGTQICKVSKLKYYFKRWKLQYQLRTFKYQRESRLMLEYFNNWKVKYDEVLKNRDLAISFDSKIIKRNQLLRWISNRNNIEDTEITADLYLQKRLFYKLFKKYHYYNDTLIEKANNFLIHNNLNDKLLLTVIIRKWKNSYDLRFQSISSYKIKYFTEEIIYPNLNSRFFVLWVNRYNEQQSTISYLSEICDQFLKTSLLKKTFLQKWAAKAKLNVESSLKAENFERTLLFKKFLLIWYDQFINKSIYLNEIADDFIDQKEFRKLSEILSNWSMKYIKNIKRNHQSCDLFIERWQNAKLRSILELWIYKLKKRRNNINEEEDDVFVDNEVSMVSNPSPLAKKSSRSFIRSTNETKNTSYLYTPLKSQVGNRFNFATPSSARTSPTKLQETTQRLKNEKIDALRKYFSKAKGSSPSSMPNDSSTPYRYLRDSSGPAAKDKNKSTPRRKLSESETMVNISPSLKYVDQSDSRFIRLSPPKVRSFKPIVPPKPPNFDASIKADEMEYSDLSTSTEILSQNIIAVDEERSVIETAKRLRRITPIMFPTDDDIAEPKFSPVNKLRERLKNNLISISPTHDNREVF